jgi:hypothetical protein
MSDATKRAVTIFVEGITAAIAVGFVASVIYDWGFGYALGLNLAQLPTTISDHFRSGVLWFPPLIGLVLFYLAVEYQLQRVERGLTEEEIVQSSKNPEKTRRFREGPYKLLPWLMLLGLIYYLMIGDTLSAVLPVALSILWLQFADWCNSVPLIRLRRAAEIRVGFALIPVAIICAFFVGYNAAVNAALWEPDLVDVRLQSGRSYTEMRLLRVFETGVFLLGKDDHISFIPTRQVTEVRRERRYQPFRGFLCEYFGRCTDKSSSSNKAPQPTASGGG